MRYTARKAVRLLFVGLVSLPLTGLAVSTALASNADSLVVGDFIYKIETDATEYVEGGTVAITFTITYTGSEPTTVEFLCYHQPSEARVFDSSESLMWASGCYPLYYNQVMDPGESIVDQHYWDTWNYPAGEPALPGVYTVVGIPNVHGGFDYTVEVVIELLDASTGISNNPEGVESTWPVIKAFFR